MSRPVYSDRVPEAEHRYAEAGHWMAIDAGDVEVVGQDEQPVTIDLSRTSLLQVLARELHEADLLRSFAIIGRDPSAALVNKALVPAVRRHPRIASALTLTWSAEQARYLGEKLIEAADISEGLERVDVEHIEDTHNDSGLGAPGVPA